MKKCYATTIILTLLLISSVYAEDTKEIVVIETFPANPTIGILWTVVIYVDHPVPEEVTVIAPLFESFSLESILKIPRRKEGTLDMQTFVEYKFIPNAAGRFVMEPFTIITPDNLIQTDRQIFNIDIHYYEQKLLSPGLVWEYTSAQIQAGDQIIIALCISNLPVFRFPPQEFFAMEIPPGAIFTALSVSPEERAGGIITKYSLIPLEGDFRIPARQLRYEDIVFEIPALHIRVTEYISDSMNLQAVIQEGIKTDVIIGKTFPEFNYSDFDSSVLYNFWKEQCEKIYFETRKLWEDGNYALALAELRRNERDHPAGVVFTHIRQKAEEIFGINNTVNESRWRKNIFFTLAVFILICIVIIPAGYFLLSKNTDRNHLIKKVILVCITITIIIASFYIFRYTDNRIILGFSTPDNFGITRETAVRRLADYDGEELFVFKEGQPVVILLNSGDVSSGLWVYVRTNDADKKTGWIPAEAVVFY